jgi:hypothetical protein
MRARQVTAVLGLAGLVLTACSQPAPSHDKTYYAAHESERATQIAACQADPGRLAATPNCINAQAADADAHAAHFYDAPKPASRVQKPGQL